MSSEADRRGGRRMALLRFEMSMAQDAYLNLMYSLASELAAYEPESSKYFQGLLDRLMRQQLGIPLKLQGEQLFTESLADVISRLSAEVYPHVKKSAQKSSLTEASLGQASRDLVKKLLRDALVMFLTSYDYI